jgi:hypothetical protein
VTPFQIFIIAAFCVYRLAVMFVKERGPAGIFKRIREWPDPERQEVLYEGLRCMWCCSVWFAALVTFALFMFHQLDWTYPWLTLAGIYWLALSGVAIAIDQLVSKK